MNILPKKRWHVRTKDNIARVRKDEGEARVVEEKRKKQLEIAESEARINFLRNQSGISINKELVVQSRANDTSDNNKLEHVDLFADFKTHIKTTNKDLEKEKKEEQEKYEKQIGYLTYLGQNTNEALKQQSWYEIAPKRRHLEDSEINEKQIKIKQTNDPLTFMKALLPAEQKVTKKFPIEFVSETSAIRQETETKAKHRHKKDRKHKKEKHKKHKKHSFKDKKYYKRKEENSTEGQQGKNKVMETLREERLRREASEKARQEALLQPKEITEKKSKNTDPIATLRVKQKYNTQFNPEIAKQNM